MNDSTVVGERYRHGDVELRSAFQPIFSFAHRRVVGHEALLRALDAEGRSVSPVDMFARCGSTAERDRLDQACRVLHAREFAKSNRSAEWLFLNVDASLFAPGNGASASSVMQETADRANLAPQQIVIEILEAAVPGGSEFEDEVNALKSIGFLIALDDFGAGHSNFDRVFSLRPHIVKMDRSVILRASRDATARRVATQMISLLHECGALVLVEGVETREEAFIALDADADFVQGYYFGRPRLAPLRASTQSRAMNDAWRLSEERAGSDVSAYRERMQPYADAIELAAQRLQSGHAMEAACLQFLQLDDSEVCFLIDDSGRQVGANHLASISSPDRATQAQFAPLLDVQGACWSRRPYFRRAIANPGQVQVTRPYLTMQSLRLCVTLSMSVRTSLGHVIVCGDVVWRAN
jgi:EAL domain-containing protein (putative c-di-GMP-specific phosphodiesterase class I)